MRTMKLKLTTEQREIFKRIGRAGGLAGNRQRKRESALLRWARVKASKPVSK
jgi:hypothetical protein